MILTIIYSVIGFALMVASALWLRAEAFNKYPQQDHDEWDDWLMYIFVGGCVGVIWPITVPFILLGVGLSRMAKAHDRRKKIRKS